MKRQPEPDAPGQIRVRYKMTPERHQVSITFDKNLFGAFRIESSGCNDRTFEELTQISGRNRRQAFGCFLTANNARFDDMQISETEGSQRCGDITEHRGGIAVGHAVEFRAWRNPHGNAIVAPYCGD